ncbi:MAG: LysR family transcriptional regulator [Alphaproteobacteria bacterium]|nr:MAG: LysR family transcriptional regulator [Alphaproteobacteria bacterium]
MNWDDFRYFLALSRAKTLSGAGQALGVKHTTIARRIAALEQTLDSRLFHRVKTGYEMTQAGENLYPHALVMEEQAQAVDRKIFGLDAQLTGPLSLTAAHDVLDHLVVPYLVRFRQAYPAIDLTLSSSSGLLDLAARQADIALRLTPNPPDYLIGKKVLPLGVGLYASRGYLCKHPVPDHVVLWENSGPNAQPDWVKQHFPQAAVTMKISDISTLLACVRHHMGVARMPCYIGDSCDDLRRLDLDLAPSTWGVWVLSHVDLRSTARVRACRDFLSDIITQQEPLICGLTSSYHPG